MITHWGEKIAHKLADSGTIPYSDVDLYSYGFFLLLSSAFYLAVVAVFGSAFSILWESIVFYFLFSVLREYAGGVHAKTEHGCMFSTTLALLLSIVGIRQMIQAELSSTAMVCLIIGCAAVFLFSPLDVPEKRLSADDWWHYRKISQRLAAAYALLGACAAIAGWPILYPLTASTILEGILLVAGTIKQQNVCSKNTE